jgi:hypothetical protein
MAMIAPVGTAALQNLIMTLHATISNGTKAASKTKKFHPAANYKSVSVSVGGIQHHLTPKASSTKRPANRMKGEDTGRYVTISAIPNPLISVCFILVASKIRITTRRFNKGIGAIA